jgi:hypothetical protein
MGSGGRIATNCPRELAQGVLIGIGCEAQNRIAIAVKRRSELFGEEFSKVDWQSAFLMKAGGFYNRDSARLGKITE